MLVIAFLVCSIWVMPIVILVGGLLERGLVSIRTWRAWRSFPWARVVRRDRLRRRGGLDITPALARRLS